MKSGYRRVLNPHSGPGIRARTNGAYAPWVSVVAMPSRKGVARLSKGMLNLKPNCGGVFAKRLGGLLASCRPGQHGTVSFQVRIR